MPDRGTTKERTAVMWAFAWGASEASFFFIVPDVWLSFVGLRGLRVGLKAALAALLGALLGGACLFEIARAAPDSARAFVIHVPGIDAELAASVREECRERGFWSLVHGVPRGIPYKVYAVESAAQHITLTAFVLGSIAARTPRFVASVLIARLVATALAKWTRREKRRETALWAGFWIVFYAFYFAHFGW